MATVQIGNLPFNYQLSPIGTLQLANISNEQPPLQEGGTTTTIALDFTSGDPNRFTLLNGTFQLGAPIPGTDPTLFQVTGGTVTGVIEVEEQPGGLPVLIDEITGFAPQPLIPAIAGGSANGYLNLLAGNDTVTAGSGTATLTGGLGDNSISLSSGTDVVNSLGNDTIFAGSGPATINASGNALVFGNGPLSFIGSGQGSSTVVGVGATAPMTIFGGQGGGLFAGSKGGNNVIAAGSQATVIFGEGNNDIMAANGPGQDLIACGSGNEAIIGVNGSGNNVFWGGTGNDIYGGGSGTDFYIAGSGSNTIIGGTGTDYYSILKGFSSGGTVDIFGFDQAKGDQLFLAGGYGANEAANALAGATVTGGATVLTLSDNTTIRVEGVTNLNASAFL